jgi:hypothetical protein
MDTQRKSGTHRPGATDRGPTPTLFIFRSSSTTGTVLSRLHLKHMNVLNSCRRPWSGSGVRLTSIMLAPQALHLGRFISRKSTSRSVMCKRSVTTLQADLAPSILEGRVLHRKAQPPLRQSCAVDKGVAAAISPQAGSNSGGLQAPAPLPGYGLAIRPVEGLEMSEEQTG